MTHMKNFKPIDTYFDPILIQMNLSDQISFGLLIQEVQGINKLDFQIRINEFVV
jgi:hypothetical protein